MHNKTKGKREGEKLYTKSFNRKLLFIPSFANYGLFLSLWCFYYDDKVIFSDAVKRVCFAYLFFKERFRSLVKKTSHSKSIFFS